MIPDNAGDIDVRSPFSGDVVGTVRETKAADVADVITDAVQGAAWMADRPAHERAAMLERAADAMDRDVEEFAALLTAEVGKPVHEARREAERAALVYRWCAAEALRQTGEVLPMDALPMGEGRLGYTVHEPCGVVVAISPFNYPAHLAAHKVGPALAAGNSVVLKPALTTPLNAIFMRDRLLEAGFDEAAVQCVVGPGASTGSALCSDPRVRKISFTGSVGVGETIAKTAGLKRLTCELGSNSALIVFQDSDIRAAATAAVHSGFVNAGQVCTSTQRILVDAAVRDEFIAAVEQRIDALRPGDPTDPTTTLGPVIAEQEAQRIVEWIEDAQRHGAQIARGGDRDGNLVQPALVVDPPTTARIWQEELFGPAVAIRSFTSETEALQVANDTRFGLSAGVFTTNLDRALRLARGLRSGSVHINNGPLWRTVFMPYGGFGESGFGKEGVKYAMQEMSELKLVVIHPSDS